MWGNVDEKEMKKELEKLDNAERIKKVFKAGEAYEIKEIDVLYYS